MATLLIAHHSPTRATRALTEAVVAGATDDAIDGVRVEVREALTTTADDLLAADGYLLGTPANFGYMSGALKHLFDSTFLAIGGALDDSGSAAGTGATTAGRSYGLYVHGRYDTTGAVRAVQAIVGALGWKQAAPVVDITGEIDDAAIAQAYELGATLAALLSE
ncbi:flavodoxin family protein [Calidifontibacter terrae]